MYGTLAMLNTNARWPSCSHSFTRSRKVTLRKHNLPTISTTMTPETILDDIAKDISSPERSRCHSNELAENAARLLSSGLVFKPTTIPRRHRPSLIDGEIPAHEVLAVHRGNRLVPPSCISTKAKPLERRCPDRNDKDGLN